MSRRAAGFADRLLRWYDEQRHVRDLPWRDRADPWGVWVSEVMLQQTRVEVVRDAWPRFMERYPTPSHWARVGDDELLQAWKGLGYYRRARMLRSGAKQVTEDHGGRVPADPETLRGLAGVGDYTYGAIASIAFGEATPAIDGNVERVLSRHTAQATDPKKAAGRKKIREAVLAVLSAERPGDFNQALMDLGARVCRPRSPLCDRCPVAADCDGLATGTPEAFPPARRRTEPVQVLARAALLREGNRILATRIPAGEINEGQFELPGPGILVPAERVEDLEEALRGRFGLEARIGPVVARVRHGITQHRITLEVHEATALGEAPRSPELQALAAGDPGVPWTTAARKVLAASGDL